jgi:hypothetical protein
MIVLVVNELFELARNNTIFEISEGLASLFNGIKLTRAERLFRPYLFMMVGVFVAPGLMAFTKTLCGAPILAKAIVRASRAAFDAL